jgi:hypothetical protein
MYITSTSNLSNRQAHLKKMFAQYQITNYKWRLKWKRDDCTASANKEKVYRRLNLKTKRPLSKIRFILLASFLY